MRKLVFAASFLILPAGLWSQVLKGTIKDTQGEPIPYATVYIRELRQGTVANTKGDYELRIPEGKYSVTWQSLGYEPEIRDVTITRTTVTINIVLQLQYYQIPEVRITASGEDPAYGIMRKVIGMAPYYLNQVSYYKAGVYLKGTLVMNRIPKLLQRSINVEARNSRGSSAGTATIKEGETYLMESFNEIEFRAPDKYTQKVISLQSTFPDQGDQISPMDFIEASFYQPVIAEMAISPLSPDAFSHYRFKYSGLSTQGDYVINKIQVIPKRKSQQLFEGTIYVIEDLWCLHSVDLVNENIAGKVRVQQLFIPVKDDIWLPVSHKFEMNISIIGVKADAAYGSSIKYNEVTANSALSKPAAVPLSPGRPLSQPSSDSEKSKNREQIEKLLAKNDLTNRDMARLSSLLEKESKASMPDSIKKSLEITDRTTYIVEKDAGRKDSAFWAEIRPIPLSENEAKSLASRVTANLKNDRELPDSARKATEKKPGKSHPLRDIASGRTWSDTSGFSFSFGGLVNLKSLSFNTVDGFVYGTDFRLNKRWKNNSSITLSPDIRYAFARETMMWRLNGQYRFERMKQSQFYLRSGMTSRDMSGAGSINPFLNTISSLFFEKNYLKLYDAGYITAGHRRELVNGLYLDIGAGYEKRKLLENKTTFTFVNRNGDYSPNFPANRVFDPPSDTSSLLYGHNHYEFSATLQWTPMQKYRIRNNVKVPAGSDYPTFSLTWEHGFNGRPSPETGFNQYDLLRFEAWKRKETGAFGEFRWRLRAGGFINGRRDLPYFDFIHFNAQPLIVLIDDYEDAFRLKNYYTLGTTGAFAEFHTKYTTPYLLLKLLPGLSRTLMRENLSLSFLWSDGNKAYTEAGYSLSEIFLLGEAGVYAGFSNLKFSGAGVRFVMRFN